MRTVFVVFALAFICVIGYANAWPTTQYLQEREAKAAAEIKKNDKKQMEEDKDDIDRKNALNEELKRSKADNKAL